MNPLKSKTPTPENIISNVFPHGTKIPIMLMIIIPIKDMNKNPRIPERLNFVVHPIIAVAVNIRPVAASAFQSIAIPAWVAAKTPINGAIVTPVIRAKAAKRTLFIGLFWLHHLEVNIIISSRAKSTYISHGYLKNVVKKYAFVMYIPAADTNTARAKNVITFPKNVGFKPILVVPL